MNKCIFCYENRFVNNRKNGFSIDDSLIYSNDCIFVTPDISPLIPGHLLIVSQEHYNSFSDAPTSVKEALVQTIQYIKDDLGYTQMTWFEHGAVFPGKGGASINHAHVHVLPMLLPVQEEVEKDRYFSKRLPFSIDLFNSLAGKQPYLWISDGNASSHIFFVDNLPSQYLRSVAMRIQGKEAYDWKSDYTSKTSIQRYKKTLAIARCNLDDEKPFFDKEYKQQKT